MSLKLLGYLVRKRQSQFVIEREIHRKRSTHNFSLFPGRSVRLEEKKGSKFLTSFPGDEVGKFRSNDTDFQMEARIIN